MDWKETNHYSELPSVIKKDVKTERKWALEGMVPVSAESGKELYANWYHQGIYHYYDRSEVRQGTPEELDAILGPEKERRRKLAKARREKEKQEEEERWDRMEEAVREAQNERTAARDQYRELCQHIGSVVLQDSSVATRTVVLDIETTGLEATWDEILQLSIIDADSGEKLFDEYFKPFFFQEWTEAQKVNNISPEMVADKPYFAEKVVEIQRIIATAHTIIGYNVYGFDVDFLRAYGISFKSVEHYIDVMSDYAVVYGDYSEYFGDFKWRSLIDCAADLGYNWGEGAAHNSLDDCYATLFCYKKLQEEEYQKEYHENMKMLEE